MAIEYVDNIAAPCSFWQGMSITLSHLLRRPMTIQYPDTAEPLRDTLPSRYRGFLEVDIDICTGCLAARRPAPSPASRSRSRRTRTTPKFAR